MSQQSLTFLSQPATTIHALKAKKIGGTATLKPGIAGTMIRKHQTHNSLEKIAEENKENDVPLLDDGFPPQPGSENKPRPQRSCDKYHYQPSIERGKEREKLGVLDLPPKPIGSIPGYSGFIPRREAANIIGETYKIGNLHSAELFAQEQELARNNIENILGPESNLRTPDTSELLSNAS